MSAEWKPGDVAMHPDYGLSVVSPRCDRHFATTVHWHHASGTWNSLDDSLGRYRPLVVIDPEAREQVARLLTAFNWPQPIPEYAVDDMQAALREFANPTPPKPDEPTGLGARATDRGGLEWAARTGLHPAPDGMGMTERRWGCLNGTASDLTWDELIDARGPLTVEAHP